MNFRSLLKTEYSRDNEKFDPELGMLHFGRNISVQRNLIHV